MSEITDTLIKTSSDPLFCLLISYFIKRGKAKANK